MKNSQQKKTSPAHQPECRRTRLAESAVAAVDICGCGMMQLHLGPLTVRMAPDAVSELLATLGRAVAAQAGRTVEARTADTAYPLFFAKRGDA